MIDPRERFSRRAADYSVGRPSYPPELLDFAQSKLGLNPGCDVADVGSGTGIFSRALLDRGCRVYGVEPNDAMREAAEEILGGDPRFTSLSGNAESTGLNPRSVDFVTAAQAFHWFDPQPTQREFARILRPEGWVLIIWNNRRTIGPPFLEDYERLMQEFGSDYRDVMTRAARAAEQLASFFVPGGGAEVFASRQSLDEARFRSRVLSNSYMPGPGDSRHEALIAELDRLFHRHQSKGVVEIEYDTELYYGRVPGQGRSSGEGP